MANTHAAVRAAGLLLQAVAYRADTSSVDAPQLKSAWLLPPVIVAGPNQIPPSSGGP